MAEPFKPSWWPWDMDLTGVANTLEQLRQRVCLYGPTATTCDCKYANRGSHGSPLGVSEASGCCELRDAITLLRSMEAADHVQMTGRITELESQLQRIKEAAGVA